MYQTAKIYKIVGNIDNSKCYIGSTVQPLYSRMSGHRQKYRKQHPITSGQIFDEYGVENCSIVLIENFPCDSKEELHKRERYWIETMDCVNKCIPSRTNQEFREDNKEKIREDKRKYRELNKEKIREHKNQHCDCECGGKYVWGSKARHEQTKKHQNFISPTIKDAV
jgi:hypothetical protein